MLRLATKAGWTLTAQPWSRSHRKKRIIRSNLHWSQEKCGVGVQLFRELKRSGYSSISRKGSDASRSSSKKPKQSVHKSSSCGGLQMAGAHFEKLCASSGISAHLTQYARSRNIELKSAMSRSLNWSLCLTSVGERVASRLRVCACLDLVTLSSPRRLLLRPLFLRRPPLHHHHLLPTLLER